MGFASFFSVVQNSLRSKMLPHDGLDMCPPFFFRERLPLGGGWHDLQRRVETQQLRPFVDALEDELQEPGLAILVFHRPLGLLRIGRLPVYRR